MGHGGARPGAGRPVGSEEKVPAVYEGSCPAVDGRYIRGLKHRVPDDVHPKLADLADFALARLVDVLTERVDIDHAPTVMKAAGMIRDEICGPVVKKIELKVGLAQLLAQAAEADALDEAEDVTPLLAEGDDEVLGRDPSDRREKAPVGLVPTGAEDHED